jgi:polysaccharide transporter, PST family
MDESSQTSRHPLMSRPSPAIGSKSSARRLLQNLIGLYGVQICTYALPLLTIPYLARVLGPSGWGLVVYAQAIGMVIACVVEYGFDISASRETSLHRTDPGWLSDLVSGVLGAKSLLSLFCIAAVMVSRRFMHEVAPSSELFWWSTIWGVCQGLNMLWFFQGLEEMKLASALEIAGRVFPNLSIFVLVHNPADGWKVIAAQCIGCAVAHGATVVLAYRRVGFCWPTLHSIRSALRLGSSTFVSRTVQGVAGSVNKLVLGAVSPAAMLGAFAGAEKITRGFQQGMWPVNQALYPNVAKQPQHRFADAMKTARLRMAFLGGLGLVFGLLIYLAAPLLVRAVLGEAYQQAIPILCVFSVWIPLTAMVTLITFQLVLPNQLDDAFNLVNLTSALVGIVAAVLLAPKFSAVGIAWSAVIAQLYTLLAFCAVLVRARLNPFARTLVGSTVVARG